MNDRGMVAAMQASDPRGLAEAYDTYAHRLYGYCCSVLHNPDAAADALQDTFVLAHERIGQLRNPERLRPWLYAIARNECLHQLRGQRRSAAIEEAGEVRDESVDLDAHLRTEELQHLVKDAFDGLNTRDREVLELAMRQDLQGTELADALGLSVNHAHALLSRARQQLESALSAVIVARNGRRDCSELSQMLESWDGTMTILMRKRINRHIGACEVCAERKHRDVSAASLLTLLPFPVLSPSLRDQVLEVVTGPQGARRRREVKERAGRFDAGGFPLPHDRWARRISPTPAKMAAAGAAGVGILVAGPFLWAGGGPADGPGPENRPGQQVTRIEPGGTVPPGTVLGPGDVVNGRTLEPGETYGPGEKVPPTAPDQHQRRGSTGNPADKPSDGSSPSDKKDAPGGPKEGGGAGGGEKDEPGGQTGGDRNEPGGQPGGDRDEPGGQTGGDRNEPGNPPGGGRDEPGEQPGGERDEPGNPPGNDPGNPPPKDPDGPPNDPGGDPPPPPVDPPHPPPPPPPPPDTGPEKHPPFGPSVVPPKQCDPC
ncbi:sigma-70 family RNA polymerase sigma factor [Streptomyces sp. NPDC002446]